MSLRKDEDKPNEPIYKHINYGSKEEPKWLTVLQKPSKKEKKKLKIEIEVKKSMLDKNAFENLSSASVKKVTVNELKVKGENLLEFEFNYLKRNRSSLTLTKVDKEFVAPCVFKLNSLGKKKNMR